MPGKEINNELLFINLAAVSWLTIFKYLHMPGQTSNVNDKKGFILKI
jgi:hypothetical protein